MLSLGPGAGTIAIMVPQGLRVFSPYLEGHGGLGEGLGSLQPCPWTTIILEITPITEGTLGLLDFPQD